MPRSSWSPSCSFTLHQSVLDLALLPGTLVPVARSHSFAPFRACAGRSKHVSSAASGRCSRTSPSRGLVEGLVCVPPSPVRRRLLAGLLRSFPTWFRRVLTSRSLPRDFFRYPLLSRRLHRESVLRTSLSHLPSASHARGTDFLSPSRCLACVAVPTLCPPRPGSCPSPRRWRIRRCLSRCHHSSFLFVNCLLEELDTVGQWQRP